MASEMTFKERLQEAAPDDVEYVTFRRDESTTASYVYTHPQRNKYKVPYDVEPEEFWEDPEAYRESGNADDFFWGDLQQVDAHEKLLRNIDNKELFQEYYSDVARLCGKNPDTTSSYTVPYRVRQEWKELGYNILKKAIDGVSTK